MIRYPPHYIFFHTIFFFFFFYPVGCHMVRESLWLNNTITWTDGRQICHSKITELPWWLTISPWECGSWVSHQEGFIWGSKDQLIHAIRCQDHSKPQARAWLGYPAELSIIKKWIFNMLWHYFHHNLINADHFYLCLFLFFIFPFLKSTPRHYCRSP